MNPKPIEPRPLAAASAAIAALLAATVASNAACISFQTSGDWGNSTMFNSCSRDLTVTWYTQQGSCSDGCSAGIAAGGQKQVTRSPGPVRSATCPYGQSVSGFDGFDDPSYDCVGG